MQSPFQGLREGRRRRSPRRADVTELSGPGAPGRHPSCSLTQLEPPQTQG